MSELSLFLPLTKVDAVNRLVYGVATAETADRAGEVCDYASAKPLYEAWSGSIAKATDSPSLGNLRAMHGKVAAGKVTRIAFNDDARQIEVCAKVVDDGEWRKVEEGVYTGFSQGGVYVKRWKGEDGAMRYTADPSEVSLIDLLRGADQIAAFLFGSADERRKVYRLIETARLPAFRFGSLLCARRSVLLAWIEEQEERGRRGR